MVGMRQEEGSDMEYGSTTRSWSLGLRHPAALVAILAVAGCVSTKAPEKTGLMQEVGVDVTSQRARMESHALAKNFMATVELTADSIARLTDEEGVRYNTLVWKANAIPAIQVSMYHPDPMISYVDGWALLIQMRQYFETGGGRDLFGSQQQLAVGALTDLEEAALATVESVGQAESVDKTERFVYQWADAHPLTNNLYLRESAAQAVAEFAEAETGAGLSALGSLSETAADAQQMALVLASYAPKQVAWQSELLVADMLDTTSVSLLLRSIDDMEVMSATTDLMTVMPGLVAEERAAVFREIARERLAVLEEISRLRNETLLQMAELITAERVAIMEDVSSERGLIFDEVRDLSEQAFAETRSLLNHVMLMIGLGLAALAILVVIGVVLLRRHPAGAG
jgi:hypothetical protein